jgi:glycosyltransferase involved in cell wall biosynthesis
MHVLQVTPYFPPTWSYGGIPRIVDGLSRALLAKNIEVTVLTTDVFDQHKRALVPEKRNYQGITVHTLPNLSNRLAYKHQLFLPLKWTSLAKKLQGIDIVHLHGHRHLLNNIGSRFARKNNIPYILTANGTLRRHERKQNLKLIWDSMVSGQIPQKANTCVAVSNIDRKIHEQYGIDPKKITQIANGLDLAEFSPLPKRGYWRKKLNVKEKLIVYLGQISPRKGVGHLIQAFTLRSLPGVSLAIAGNDMGALQEAKKLAQEHPNIHFLGTLAGNDRLQLLSDADLLVYASSNEIFGLSPFEGLLCGAPAIVGDDCGCGQLISEAQAGLLVQHGDIDTLSLKIRTLLYDSRAAHAMVQRGREFIRHNLRFEIVAEKHIELYKRIIEQHG